MFTNLIAKVIGHRLFHNTVQLSFIAPMSELFIQDRAVRVGFPNNSVWLFPEDMEEAFNFVKLTSLLLSECRAGSYNTSGIKQTEELVIMGY